MLILKNVSWFVASVAYSGLDLGEGEPTLYSFNVHLTPRPPLHIPGLLPCYAYSCHMSKLRKNTNVSCPIFLQTCGCTSGHAQAAIPYESQLGPSWALDGNAAWVVPC